MKEADKLVSTISVVLITLIILWAFSDQKPPSNLPEAETAADFSMNNVRAHLEVISAEVHHVGTKAHKEVQNYLVDELAKLGLKAEIQVQTVFTPGGSGTTIENVITRIDGTENGDALMLLSHYDSAVPFSRGAGDDGSGIATILEGLRVFLEKGISPKNDIVILFSDAEELGLLGARAFIENHAWADEISLIINFEARGSGGPSFMLMETNGKNSRMLQEFLKANPTYPSTSSLSYSVYKMLPNDTDLTPFRENANINGYNFAYIDDHFDYHTAQDINERLDVSTLAHQADYLMSTLNYFAFNDISDLNSDRDRIFVNFPLIKMLHYPFAWNTTLFIVALMFFNILLTLGFKQGKFTKKGTIMGFVPFLISLLGCTLVTYGLWKLALIIHPHYKDILQGFTYNGYQYIAAFCALNIWLSLAVYNRYITKYTPQDLLLAPLTFWFIVNGLVLFYLPGAAFFIIPVFMAIATLAFLTQKELPSHIKIGLFVFLSIPMLYMLSPMIKLFPVALGLGALFISTMFLVLMLGLILPIVSLLSIRKPLKIGIGVIAALFFAIATINSGSSVERKKPTNITFYHNADLNVSYWASLNQRQDEYTRQFLGEDPTIGPMPEESGVRSTRIRYHKKTENRNFEVSEVTVNLDSIVGDERRLEFTVNPKRNVHRYELISNDDQEFSNFSINGALVGSGNLSRTAYRLMVRYTMANSDSILQVSCTMNKEMVPDFRIVETSYDLETNPVFQIDPKPEYMMPFAFVTGDAVVAIQTPVFDSMD
ncbi:MAG: M20/M25/M40 family metallo-hydrolase [Cyclobacteriaceae bacterium]